MKRADPPVKPLPSVNGNVNMAKRGLYANIHAKRARGGKMRKPGSKGAPTAQNFKDAAKTAKKNKLKIK